MHFTYYSIAKQVFKFSNIHRALQWKAFLLLNKTQFGESWMYTTPGDALFTQVDKLVQTSIPLRTISTVVFFIYYLGILKNG